MALPTLGVGTALSPPKKWKFEIWGGAGDGGAGLFAPPRAGVFTLGYVARGVRVRDLYARVGDTRGARRKNKIMTLGRTELP